MDIISAILTSLQQEFSHLDINLNDRLLELDAEINNMQINVKNNILYKKIILFLNVKISFHPEDIVGLMYLRNLKSAKDIINIITDLIPFEYNQKNIIKLKIAYILYFANNSYSEILLTENNTNRGPTPLIYQTNRELLINTTNEIEKSCFNATIKISKESQDPPYRNWSSPIFMDIYSTRCGTIISLLDPNSISCKTYGPITLYKLLNNIIKPINIGLMNEKELCPNSIKNECDEISRQMGQKVVEKVSTMFQCPFCKQHKCSYTQVQLRSADEAPDYRCRCLNSECLKQFRG